MTPVITARCIGKRFRHRAATPTIIDVLRGARRDARRQSFWALRDVSFEVERARTLGIIGPNGAGKSTLLRLLAGVGRPDEGKLSVVGRVGAIFELGTGFHPEQTGRESAMLAGVISGLSRSEMRRRLPEVVGFAELEEFLDDPIRTYSSGMVARLAFAIAIHVDADVLLVDEAIAVGDIAFQQRCFDRLKTLQRGGTTMVVVSHAPATLRQLCDDVIWLQGGRIEARGRPDEVSASYAAKMREVAHRVTPPDLQPEVTEHGIELRGGYNRLGSQEARLTAVSILDRWGESVVGSRISSGDPLDVVMEFAANKGVGDLNVAVHIVREDDGVLCVNASSLVRAAHDGRPRRVRLECFRLDLAPGTYSCEIGLYSLDWARPYDYHAGAYLFSVEGERGRGVLAAPIAWHRDAGDLTVER